MPRHYVRKRDQVQPGSTYGTWTVLADTDTQKDVRCVCVCGTERIIPRLRLLRGTANECSGCYARSRVTPVPILSLGAGVQSSTLLLMARDGLVTPRPRAALFADTGWEGAAVYRHLEWLEKEVGADIPIQRVSAGNLREEVTRLGEGGASFASMPLHARFPNGKRTILQRQCTRRYKIDPIRQAVRELLGGLFPCELWLGISTEEAHRMKESREQFLRHRYPLIELGMSRADCLAWCRENGYPEPPQSACIGCPFQSKALWQQLAAERPEEFADAVAVDAAIRKLPWLAGEMFLHPSLLPLPMAVQGPAEGSGSIDGFGNECEGLCGV
jgi:hypothetical protein